MNVGEGKKPSQNKNKSTAEKRRAGRGIEKCEERKSRWYALHLLLRLLSNDGWSVMSRSGVGIEIELDIKRDTELGTHQSTVHPTRITSTS